MDKGNYRPVAHYGNKIGLVKTDVTDVKQYRLQMMKINYPVPADVSRRGLCGNQGTVVEYNYGVLGKIELL